MVQRMLSRARREHANLGHVDAVTLHRVRGVVYRCFTPERDATRAETTWGSEVEAKTQGVRLAWGIVHRIASAAKGVDTWYVQPVYVEAMFDGAVLTGCNERGTLQAFAEVRAHWTTVPHAVPVDHLDRMVTQYVSLAPCGDVREL